MSFGGSGHGVAHQPKWSASVSPKSAQVPAGSLPQIREELEGKYRDVSVELKEVGFQPKSTTHAIFNQCRLFDSVFRKTLNDTATTALIREAFAGPSGLRENVRQLKLDTFFNGTYVRQVCRQADGFQPHLVSPENGLKLLIKEAMSYVEPSAEKCVDDVKFTLLSTVQTSARDLDKHTFNAQEAAALRPTSQQMLIDISRRAIDSWSEAAREAAMKLVKMEGDYITAHFFRRLAEARENEMAQSQEGSDEGSDGEMPTPITGRMTPVEDSLQALNIFGDNANDYMMGFMEKNSETHKNVPLETWKWQKRWFVLSESKRKLYYFKDPDELPHYRGIIDMSNCVVEDLAAQSSRSRQLIQSKNGNGGSSFSLLISLSSADQKSPIHKDRQRVILRCENASSKYEWFARLRQCSSSNSNSTPRRSSVHNSQNLRSSGQFAGSMRTGSMPEISPIKSVWGDILADDERLGARRNKGSPLSAYFKQTLKGQKPGDTDGQFYNTLGQDLSVYTHMVLESLCRSIPKAVVHCQVKRAECEMLEQLYADVNELSSEQLESMTFEGSDVTQRRAALINAKADLQTAKEVTEGLISSISGLLDDKENVQIPQYVLELAGMLHIAQGAVEPERTISMGPYTPKALRTETSRISNGTNIARPTGLGSKAKPRLSSSTAAPAALSGASVRPSPPRPAPDASSAKEVKIKPRRRPPPPPPK